MSSAELARIWIPAALETSGIVEPERRVAVLQHIDAAAGKGVPTPRMVAVIINLWLEGERRTPVTARPSAKRATGQAKPGSNVIDFAEAKQRHAERHGGRP